MREHNVVVTSVVDRSNFSGHQEDQDYDNEEPDELNELEKLAGINRVQD